ncbi:hypothetical protein QCE63_31595 [Caballeronia sp. LZ065]|uniref:hypothetical protein n=1 Tax=Caballeronia sp. LZ065 TaxID=3038571 RepID=UPI00285BBC29|nr:hypothetical protein [Caballeronia sp. LZ065]MDR5783966.1 hypothetical protein [Caballeronia sp. LZ065]
MRTFNPQLHAMHAMLVSRAASHVASALRTEGRAEALAEGIAEVIAHCGHAGLGLFLAAVWHWLDERDYHEAAHSAALHRDRHGADCQISAEGLAPARRAHLKQAALRYVTRCRSTAVTLHAPNQPAST